MNATSIVGYLALFIAVGFLFLFVNLMVGWLLRPKAPNAEKLEVYECGEPTIGSSFVQFDLRFYVVALLFIIFDVEVAFFFPWATVFGKATHLMNPKFATVSDTAPEQLTASATLLFEELGVRNPATDVPADSAVIATAAQRLALATFTDIVVFFAVLLVGFAYVWKRGDLDWVRAMTQERQQTESIPPPDVSLRVEPREPMLVG